MSKLQENRLTRLNGLLMNQSVLLTEKPTQAEKTPGEEVAKFIAQQQQEDPVRFKQEKLPKGDALVKAFRKGNILQIELVAGQTLELIENIQEMFEQINHPGLVGRTPDLKKLRKDISASIMKLEGSIQTAVNRARTDRMKKYLLDTYKRLKRLLLRILKFQQNIQSLLGLDDGYGNLYLTKTERIAGEAALVNIRQIKSDIEKAQQKLRSVPALGIQDTERSYRSQQGPEQVATARGSGRGARRSYKRKCSAKTKPYIRIGCGGDNVELIQTVLYKKYKDTTLKGVKQEDFIDGKYGKTTSNIVKQFQKENGIRRDGIVGPETIKKMIEVFGPALTGKGKAGPVATKKGPAGKPGQPAQDALGPFGAVPPPAVPMGGLPKMTARQAVDTAKNMMRGSDRRFMRTAANLAGRAVYYLIDKKGMSPEGAYAKTAEIFGPEGEKVKLGPVSRKAWLKGFIDQLDPKLVNLSQLPELPAE